MSHTILARPIASLTRSLAFLACSGIAAANTWIVDAAGGPGHHFTAIQPAIAAAAPGDLILVRQGTYAAFTLDKGLTVMGELPAVPRFDGVVTVTQIAAGERAALVGFTVHPWQGASELQVTQCGGFVLVQASTVRRLTVTASADVRVDHLTSGPAFVQGSRFEASASSFLGVEGAYGLGTNGGAGSAGIWGYGQSRLHLALTSALGGAGGGASHPSSAGNGGPGVSLSDSQGLLFGAGHLIKGGFAGDGGLCSLDGYPGPGLLISPGAAWSSGVLIERGGSYCNPSWPPPVVGGPHIQLQPDHPTLELIGTPLPGQQVTFRVRAPQGSSVRLHLGRNPQVQALPGVLVEKLTDALRTLSLGGMPPGEQIDHVLTLPSILPRGMLVIGQASATLPGGTTMLTNSVPCVVR